MPAKSAPDLFGPSPRGWGNLSPHFMVTCPVRAIPTRVGKSRPDRPGPRPRAGHPHAGGEIELVREYLAGSNGPSPRGWGNPTRRQPALAGRRAIPTRVGKSPSGNQIDVCDAGHPHAGGEICVAPRTTPRQDGPSPRGWGNRLRRFNRQRPRRAIPTRVGKSGGKGLEARRGAGHPHAGGEIFRVLKPEGVLIGPSPRGWGNQSTSAGVPLGTRAIPTRVGKSTAATTSGPYLPGHPHAGGEIL